MGSEMCIRDRLMAGHNLLQGENVVHLQIRQTVDNGTSVSRIHYADDGAVAPISEGRLRGLIQARDEVVPKLLTDLDEMAVAVDEVTTGLDDAVIAFERFDTVALLVTQAEERASEATRNLAIQDIGLAQLPAGRQFQQLPVRGAAPEEHRQPRRQLVIGKGWMPGSPGPAAGPLW